MRLIIAIFFILASYINALVLEDMAQNQTLADTLSYKKIGCFVGSFDPIHVGHEDVLDICLKQNLVDFIIVFPHWGGDSYKDRVNIKYRVQMLYSLYKDHPRIIITSLPPQQMQAILTKPTLQQMDGKYRAVEPLFEGTTFVGIIGSDVAFKITHHMKELLTVFMRGYQIPREYYNHTLGGMMAFPIKYYIISQREGANLEELHGKVGDIPIGKVIYQHDPVISSSRVKKMMLRNEPVENYFSPKVLKIIQDQNLYKM